MRDGVLSERQAREVYGVVLARDDAGGWRLDAAATGAATVGAVSDDEGHWEQIPDALYATTTARCDLCGKMIVGRLWRVRHAGRSLGFCDRRCQRTWLEYWLPRYGGAEPAAGTCSTIP